MTGFTFKWNSGHWFVAKKTALGSFAPSSSSPVSVIHPNVCQSSHWRSKKSEYVNVWFSPSKSLPLKLPACFAHMSTWQSKAGWQFSTKSLPLAVRIFNTTSSLCLCIPVHPDAEIHFVNMTSFTSGGLHSSFWVVDRTHIYIGSADMSWRSLSKVTTSNKQHGEIQSRG